VNPSEQSADELFLASFGRQAECYERALALAEQFSAVSRAGETRIELIAAIAEIVRDVSRLQQDAAEERKRSPTAAPQPDSRLQSAVNRVATLIQRLAERMREAEMILQGRKTQLGPELDLIIRSCQMQKAYQACR
jgi:hypothetical protein